MKRKNDNIEELEFIDFYEENNASVKSAYETDKNTQQNTEGLISQYDTTEQEPDNTDKFDIERAARRKKRLQEMKRRKKRQELIRRFFIPGAVILVICAFLAGIEIKKLFDKHETKKQNNVSDESANAEISTEENEQEKKKGNAIGYNHINIAGCFFGNAAAESIAAQLAYISSLHVQTLGGRNDLPLLSATADDLTQPLNDAVVSKNGVFIDIAEGRIMAQRDAGARISPASMTKILTILVAAEHITNPDDMVEITRDIADYSFSNECSVAGFEVGEKVSVRDLFYGTVLPSGADAALGLAIYVAGSQDAFVELMNQKLEEMGLSKTTHFTNCVGIYDDNHYSTAYDIGVILKAAYDNSFCREVLSAHRYTTAPTEQHPDGLDLSNLFLRRIEDRDTHGEVLCAKTGFVEEAGSCAASLGIGLDGKEYICVTVNSLNQWQCIKDQVALYQQLLPGEQSSD
mgnify:CR=1 FL=1